MKQSISCISLVVVLIALTTTGCEEESKEPFIGKWELQFLHKVAYVDNAFLGDTTIYFDPGDSWIEYKDDGTGSVHDIATYDFQFRWSLNGDSIAFMVTGQLPYYFHIAAGETTLSWSATAIKAPYTLNPAKTYKEVWYHWAIKM